MLTSGDTRSDSAPAAPLRTSLRSRVNQAALDAAVGQLAALAVSCAPAAELGSRLARAVLRAVPEAAGACVAADPPLYGSAGKTPGDDVRLAWRLADGTREDGARSWPDTCRDLAERCGYGSVAVEPLLVGTVTVGALGAFGEPAGAFGEATHHALRTLALPVAARLTDATALLSWRLYDDEAAGAIERAAGVLMARHRISAGAAVVRLRRAARRSGRDLTDVAADLLQTVERVGPRRDPPGIP